MARTHKPELVFLDTHIVCWLFEGRVELLSALAAEAIERETLRVSPMVELELQYLHEIGRIKHDADTVITALNNDIGLQVDDQPLAGIVAQARNLSWTRDPFDRLIVAHAMLLETSLITRDQLIQQYYPKALW